MTISQTKTTNRFMIIFLPILLLNKLDKWKSVATGRIHGNRLKEASSKLKPIKINVY